MTHSEVSGSMEKLQPRRYHLGTLEQHSQRVCERQGEGVSQMVPSKALSAWLQTMTVELDQLVCGLSRKQLGKMALSWRWLREDGSIVLSQKRFRIDGSEWALFVYSKSNPVMDIVTRAANLRNHWAPHK